MTQELPVHILYDKEKVDENANIQKELVVPVGAARTRSQNDHEAGRRVYAQLRDGIRLRDGWTYKPPAPQDPRLALIAKYDPQNPRPNVIDTHITGVLRLSRGILGFGSIQSTSALAARAAQQATEGMVPSLNGTPAQGNPPPANMPQLMGSAAKDAGTASRPLLRRLVMGNGKK